MAIFSGFNVPKIIKMVTFGQSYSKNKKVDVFFWGGGHGVDPDTDSTPNISYRTLAK